MVEGQAYLVWPLGKVKCFDTLHPSLKWNVWCCHAIVDKWQTLETARHHVAQWKSSHHVCERSRVQSPVLSLSKFMFKTCQLPPSNHTLSYLGYQLDKLTSFFQKVMDNAKAYLRGTTLDHLCAKSSKEASHGQQDCLHQPYHTANPLSKTIQKLWVSWVATPPGQPPFSWLTNEQGYSIHIEHLTIACDCPPNLGNLLSYRKLHNHSGLKVLSFIMTWFEYAPYFLSRGQGCSKKYYRLSSLLSP